MVCCVHNARPIRQFPTCRSHNPGRLPSSLTADPETHAPMAGPECDGQDAPETPDADPRTESGWWALRDEGIFGAAWGPSIPGSLVMDRPKLWLSCRLTSSWEWPCLPILRAKRAMMRARVTPYSRRFSVPAAWRFAADRG